MDVFRVSSSFCLHNSDRVSWVLCLISVIHLMMLLLCFQCCYLVTWRENEKSELLMNVFCVFFLLSSQLILSSVSVVFDFNDSLNDVAPISPILFPVYAMRKKWIVDECLSCIFFLLFPLLILSWVSVVFDFNDSLNDAAPVSPMSFPVYAIWKGKGEWLMGVFRVFLSFVFTTKIKICECCVWF